MELANIEKLVGKYENAETTLQEEATLKAYFLSDNVAPHLEEYQMMFAYFQTSQDETYTKTIAFKPEKKRNYKWLSVAASVVLLVSVYMGSSIIDGEKTPVMTPQEQEQYAQVENALRMLSSNLKKGNDAFNNLYTYENTVNKIFKTK
tara:strand:+ start:32238 stop:32681 length:444 start_codon:yes stop_codon:yes gene_type:complete